MKQLQELANFFKRMSLYVSEADRVDDIRLLADAVPGHHGHQHCRQALCYS